MSTENTAPTPPYPRETKAKGWRFELDLEQVMQSDTWALAHPSIRPWLLMLWAIAWQQVPCGSMPADDELIIARLGIEREMFEQHKRTLLRGWWLASDGRLYHPTITQRVLDMLGRKNAEKTRKAEWRRRKEAEAKLAEASGHPAQSGVIDEMSRGTDMGLTPESHGTDDTGTGTGTGTGLDSSYPPPREDGVDSLSRGTSAGHICRAMRTAGLADVNPSHPKLRALIDAGASREEFVAAAAKAVQAQAGFAYALTIVANERQRAAALAATIHHGALPNKQEAIEVRNKAVGAAWLAQQGVTTP